MTHNSTISEAQLNEQLQSVVTAVPEDDNSQFATLVRYVLGAPLGTSLKNFFSCGNFSMECSHLDRVREVLNSITDDRKDAIRELHDLKKPCWAPWKDCWEDQLAAEEQVDHQKELILRELELHQQDEAKRIVQSSLMWGVVIAVLQVMKLMQAVQELDEVDNLLLITMEKRAEFQGKIEGLKQEFEELAQLFKQHAPDKPTSITRQ